MTDFESLPVIHARNRESCSRPLYAVQGDGNNLNQRLIQLSSRLHFGGATWLLYLSDVTSSLDAIFSDVDIPFDSELLVAQYDSHHEEHIFTEVYRVARQLPLQKDLFGTWSRTRGLRGPDKSFRARRNNLQGLNLRAGTNDDYPISFQQRVNGKNKLGGVYGGLWTTYENILNCSISVDSLSNRGVKLSNGSWTGLNGMILRDEIDMAVLSLSYTSEWLDEFDMTLPATNFDFRFFIREPVGQEVNWHSVTLPFSPPLWSAVFATTIICALILTLLDNLSRRLGNRQQENTSSIDLRDSIYCNFVAMFCLQGHSHNPETGSARIVVIIGYLSGVIFLSSYSAVLTSNLTIRRPELPFTTLEGLLEHRSYTWGTHRLLIPFQSFLQAKEGLLKELRDKKMSHNSVNHLDGMQRVCRQKYVFLDTASVEATFHNEISCALTSLPQSFVKFGTTHSMFPKRSPYFNVFNYNYLRIVERGIRRRMTLISRPSVKRTFLPDLGIKFEVVTPVFTILLGGVLLSLVALVVELAWNKSASLLRGNWGRI